MRSYATDAELLLPYYSVCSVGKGRWFWCVWESWHALFDGKSPFILGYSPDKATAEDEAAAAAGQDGRLGRAYDASYFHRQISVKKRMETPAKAAGAGRLEFVYRSWYSDEGREEWTPYRIVKRTKTRVYVDIRHYRPEAYQTGNWYDFDKETFTLDRSAFERDGYAYSRSRRDRFYLKPEDPTSISRQSPHCFALLGVVLPCTAAEVKRAYRQKVRATHPDMGGDATDFTAVQHAYEEALSLIGEAA